MKEKENTSLVLKANEELNNQLSDPSVMRALVATIFKGFRDDTLVRQACLEAMMRGYSFQDIVNKKIYAIPFGGGYSLVQSISDVRTIAMNNGQVGKDAPVFEEKDGKIISCTITIKRKIGDYVGDYTATAFFDEYKSTKDIWIKKPKTMISKVAEMHALRMAFPEKLSLSYVEEEFQSKPSFPTPDKFNKELAEASQDTPQEDSTGKVGDKTSTAKLDSLDEIREQVKIKQETK